MGVFIYSNYFSKGNIAEEGLQWIGTLYALNSLYSKLLITVA
jgi:hypothetical protein